MKLLHVAIRLLLLGSSLTIAIAQNDAQQMRQQNVLQTVMLPENNVSDPVVTKEPIRHAAKMAKVPIVPAEDIDATQPIVRVSKASADKVVAFITSTGHIFEIQDEEGMGIIEGRQAPQNLTNRRNESYVCNVASVLIYSDEPCDDITVVEKITTDKLQTAVEPTANSTNTQHEIVNIDKQQQNRSQRVNGKRRRNNRKRQQVNRRRRAQAQKNRRRNKNRKGIRRPLENNRKRQQAYNKKIKQLNKRRRQLQQQKQQNRRKQKQRIRNRRRHQNGVQQKRRPQRKQPANLNENLVQVQQGIRGGQRVRYLIRRGNTNAQYPRWQWADAV